MTPLGQSPLLLGADIVIHSATKFLSGHSDLIAGAVITNNEAISDLFNTKWYRQYVICSSSWTLAKHLKTFPIRFEQILSKTRKKYVSFLIKQDEISEVYYPGLTASHLEQAKNGGAVIGLRLADESKAQQFVDALTLPLVSVSLGGVETILSHPATMSHATLPEEVRQERGITFGLFRLSVGLEDPDELIADIKYALKEAFNESIPHTLKDNVLVADGAIGTILYSEGLDTCPEAYNLSHPDKVERIHRSYIEAGADVIQTNTYGANFEKLKRFGLEDKVKAIHQATIRIAKKAANKDTYILGTVGGFRGIKQEDISLQTILYHTEIQIDTLIEEGVDALLFETYYDLEELTNVISRTRKKYDIPNHTTINCFKHKLLS